MRCTGYVGKDFKKTQAMAINPDSVDVVAPHSKGTLLEIGPEQVVVVEEYRAVVAALEQAWADRYAFAELMAPAKQLLGILPVLLPAMLQDLRSRAGETTPPPALSQMVRCRQCNREFAKQEKCPGCGSDLTS